METFEISAEALRARQNRKWSLYPAPVLPAWIADMDFTVAPPVQAAIERLAAQQNYGYVERAGDAGLSAAFAARMRERFDWAVQPEQVQIVTELIQAMAALVSVFSQPGDGIVVQTPIYPPFLNTIATLDRRLVDNPLADDGARFALDIDGLRRIVDDQTRMILFCNPHNPSGRVFTREELLAVGQVAIERDLVIVCDEIHADLIYDGRRHLPLAGLSNEIAARTVTITSATKSFNIAGLRCAVMHFGSAALHERFRRALPEAILGRASIVGIDATIAAWRHGQPWLDAVLQRLETNRDRLTQAISEQMPGVRYYAPEGTYLAWLDCAALQLSKRPQQFFLEEAGVGLNDGAAFGPQGQQCVRLNFATSAAILDQIIDRMAAALRAVAV